MSAAVSFPNLLIFAARKYKTITPKGDENKFAENILKLLSDKDLYKEKSREARDLIVSVWDWKKRAAEILSKVFEI